MVYCEMIMSLLYCHYLGKCVLIHVLSWVTLWLPLPILIRSTVKFHRCALHMYILHERVVLSPSCGNICVCVHTPCSYLLSWVNNHVFVPVPHPLCSDTKHLSYRTRTWRCVQSTWSWTSWRLSCWTSTPKNPRMRHRWPRSPFFFCIFLLYVLLYLWLRFAFFSDLCTDTELSLFFQCYGSYVTSTVQIFIFLYKLKPKI